MRYSPSPKREHSSNVGRGVDSFSLMKPVGICTGITPFNFPAMVPLWMFPIALACGNTFILKPSEKDLQYQWKRPLPKEADSGRRIQHR